MTPPTAPGVDGDGLGAGSGSAQPPSDAWLYPSLGPLDDEILAERASRGDRAAFEELARRHADRLYGVVLRFGADPSAAEEIVQEAFLRAWRAIASFQGRSQFFTWLYRIGLNEAKRHIARQLKRPVEVPFDQTPVQSAPDWSSAPEPRAERRDLRAALERAVRALPDGYREALILRDVEGLSTREAASVLGVRQSAFKSRLHRARLAVREAVADYLDDNGSRRER